MLLPSRGYYWILIIAFLFIGCGSKINSSRLEHKFNETSHPRETPLENCTSLKKNDPKLLKTNSYLNQLSQVVFNANLQSFQGYYAPENFCVEAIAQGNIFHHTSIRFSLALFNRMRFKLNKICCSPNMRFWRFRFNEKQFLFYRKLFNPETISFIFFAMT